MCPSTPFLISSSRSSESKSSICTASMARSGFSKTLVQGLAFSEASEPSRARYAFSIRPRSSRCSSLIAGGSGARRLRSPSSTASARRMYSLSLCARLPAGLFSAAQHHQGVWLQTLQRLQAKRDDPGRVFGFLAVALRGQIACVAGPTMRSLALAVASLALVMDGEQLAVPADTRIKELPVGYPARNRSLGSGEGRNADISECTA
jgi:hypothetical protein